MIPYPYQNEALKALDLHIRSKDTNPCVVIPTGGGKSALMAWSIDMWKKDCPWFRCCILAHRKELIVQNASELKAINNDLDIGIYSASLGRKDYDTPILYASIDSIYNKSGEFAPWDTLFIDEAHRIPFKGEGKYRTFITECKKFNPSVRIIGWTATAFRMDGGKLCHKDHILNEICYEANVRDLINDGYLCNLRSKIGESQPNLLGIRKSMGDYIIKALSERTNLDEVVHLAVEEAVKIINKEKRNSIIFYCVDVEHCRKVSRALGRLGLVAPFVTAKTEQRDRDRIVNDFRAGYIRAVCNVNIWTEGFNARNIDCIVLLRPTLSAGLYSQMVGRGLRTCRGKTDCLILDFANCINEHGPIDLLDGKPIVLAICGECREAFSRTLAQCPICGWKIPRQEISRLESMEKAKRRLHGTKASNSSILSNQPRTYEVDAVNVFRHRKDGSPDSIRVTYRCGTKTYRDWICLDHPGLAGTYARQWWAARFGDRNMTVNKALQNLFINSEILQWTKTITVVKSGKYNKIISYNDPAGKEMDANEGIH